MISDKVFIFFHWTLKVGGIENAMVNIIRELLKNDVDIKWISRDKRFLVDSIYESSMINRIDKISWRSILRNINKNPLHIYRNQQIVIVVFCLYDYICISEITDRYRKFNIKVFYMVPHHNNKTIYVDKYFFILRNYVKKVIGNFYRDLDMAGALIFFSIMQIRAIERYYHLNISNKEKKIYDTRFYKPALNEESIKQKAKTRKEEFNIVTISRFEFPHKGYIIGLINNFAKIRQRYDFLKLLIIGYGDDKNTILEQINRIDDINIRKDILIIGKKSPEEIRMMSSYIHLNIGLSGSLTLGALCGILSIPVRQYNYDCEAYGFLNSTNYERVISQIKGEDIMKYIEQAINMPDDQYINETLKGYYAAIGNSYNCDPLYLYYTENKKTIYHSPVLILVVIHIIITQCIEILISVLTKPILARKLYNLTVNCVRKIV